MDQKRRDRLEERLLEERRSALEALGHIDDRDTDEQGENDGDLTNYPLHIADDGTDTMEQEKQFLLASKEGRQVHQIDEALRRIYREPEQAGTCAVCGRDISDERLDLIPWTMACSEHAEQDPNTAQPA